MKINTNLSSLIVQSGLKASTNGLNTAIERLTTGSKINHAKDNAANYAINTKLSTQINAYQNGRRQCQGRLRHGTNSLQRPLKCVRFNFSSSHALQFKLKTIPMAQNLFLQSTRKQPQLLMKSIV